MKNNIERNEVNILKAAIANMVDQYVGSTSGWTEERDVPLLMKRIGISRAMAITILEATDTIRNAHAYELI